jgi:hypothetical protein
MVNLKMKCKRYVFISFLIIKNSDVVYSIILLNIYIFLINTDPKTIRFDGHY